MPAPSAKLRIAVDEGLVCLRLCGRPNFNTSLDFKSVVAAMRERGHSRFVMDLTECIAMDSTFLGVLAAFARDLTENTKPPGQVELLNPLPGIADFLENLEVLHLFQVRRAAAGLERCYEAVPSRPADKKELLQVSHDAHQALMEISPANVRKFKDVVRFLEEDLKRAGSG